MTATATFAGGCFWCLEAVFKELAGVLDVESGYAGGSVANPSYELVCGGRTGHAEVVRLRFDQAVITYQDLLGVFFSIHDPTTLNRQGGDVGSQYRSAIFFHDEDQRMDAGAAIAQLEAEHVFPAPVVTEVAAAGPFYAAEDYHRDYFTHFPAQPYCVYVVGPKVSKARARFAHLLKRARPGVSAA